MKLSTQAVLRLVAALETFDGVGQRGPGDKTRRCNLSRGVRMTMAKNLVRLMPIVDAFQKARNDLIYKHSEGSNQIEDPKKLALFEQDEADLKAATHEVRLDLIKEADLKIDANGIALPTLAGLAPMVEGLAEETVPVTFDVPKRANGAAQPCAEVRQ
jgi:hypothetical protein